MSGALLVTNNTSRGRINAFDPKSGAFLGPCVTPAANPSRSTTSGPSSSARAAPAGANGNPTNSFHRGNNNYGDGTFAVITFGH